MTLPSVPRANTAEVVRPTTLADVIGQGEVTDALRVALSGASSRGELPGHMLLGGPAGTGKTTLALCIANAIGGRLVNLIGPSLRYPSDLMDVLMVSRPRDVIFIDEIHRMWRNAQEFMFPVMEDGKLYFESTGRTLQLDPILFIGATTEPERLLTPMLDRFALVLRLRRYTDDELSAIATRAATKFNTALTPEAALTIAKAADGIPRVAIRLVRAARDYAYTETSTGYPIMVGGSPFAARTPESEKVTIGEAAVQRVLSSSAYAWRVEGRSAG